MINVILLLLLFAGTFYAAILYASEALALLAFGVILYLVGAYLFLFYQCWKIKSTIVVPIVTGEKGKKITYQIKVNNRGRFPAVKIKYKIQVLHELSNYSQKKMITGMAPSKTEITISSHITGNISGAYEIAIVKMKLYDLAGFLYLEKKCKDTVEFQVLPDFYAVNIQVGQASRHFVGETDVYEDKAGGHDQSELLEIREFRDGDKIQSVHWKLSAKTDELMVRENKLPHGCAVVVLLDLFQAQGKSDVERTEAFLQFIASLSFSLLEEKCSHYMAWYCGKEQQIIRVRVEKEEDLYLFLMLFYREEPAHVKRQVREEYRQKYKMENYVTDICVNRVLQIQLNGDYLTNLSADKLEEECKKLELIV